MCEVDDFEHPRFCDEFSHIVKRRSFSTAKSLLNSHLNGIDVLDFFCIVIFVL